MDAKIEIIIKGKPAQVFDSTNAVHEWLKSGGFTRDDVLLLVFWDDKCIYSKLGAEEKLYPSDLIEFFGTGSVWGLRQL